MESVAQFLRVSISSFVFALGAIVVFQLLTGRINLTGLLQDKRSKDLSPSRVQLLVVALLSVFYCLKSGLGSDEGTLHVLPPEMLTLIGGSQGLYLADKYISHRKRKGSS